MKPEARMWKLVREKVAGWGHFVRIENEVGSGQPDVNWCVDGQEGWWELKVWPRELEGSQVRWEAARREAGGTALLMVKKSTAVYVLTFFWYSRASIVPRDFSIVEQNCLWSSDKGWDELRKLMCERKS